jgi:metal-responsive CopG/Arc/MetJ family transcriptional regulator
MAHRIGPSEGEAQLFAIRLTDAQRALLDEMVQEDPKDSRSAILRRAFDEYVERRSKADPAA